MRITNDLCGTIYGSFLVVSKMVLNIDIFSRYRIVWKIQYRDITSLMNL